LTDKTRLEVAKAYRQRLDAGVHRKEAIRQVMRIYAVSRVTVYRCCWRFNVSTG